MPALLTRIDTAPNSLAIASISASTAAASVTSRTRPTPPCAASRSPIAAAPASLVAVPITFAPARARVSAIAAPMPRLAPVTRATSPVRIALLVGSRIRWMSYVRPHHRLRRDHALAVERERRRTIQHVAQGQRLAHAPAELIVVRAGQQPVDGKIVRGLFHRRLHSMR